MNFGRSTTEHEDLILPYEVGFKPLPRQVVTLAFLSGQIPVPHVSESLARSLCAETEANVVLVRLESQESATDENTGPEFFLNGEFHLPSRIRRTDEGFYSLSLGLRNDPPTPAGINSLIRQLSRHFRYVLIETAVREQPTPWLPDLLLRSDLAYLFFRPTTDDVFHLDQIMRETRPRCRNGGVHLKPIACLAEGERINGFDALAQRVASPVHLFVRGCPKVSDPRSTEFQVSPKSLFRADLRRLAREIGGRLVGL